MSLTKAALALQHERVLAEFIAQLRDYQVANYATFDTGDGTTYAVYFDLMRFKTRGPNTVLLTVESAYVHEPGKPDTTEGRISFNALLGHALRGTKPKSPPRAR